MTHESPNVQSGVGGVNHTRKTFVSNCATVWYSKRLGNTGFGPRSCAVVVKKFSGYKTVTIFFHRESASKSERALASCHLSLFLCLFCRELHRELYRESQKRSAEHPPHKRVLRFAQLTMNPARTLQYREAWKEY